jgi:hypothetical protein
MTKFIRSTPYSSDYEFSEIIIFHPVIQ